jgi:hypothetical protein
MRTGRTPQAGLATLFSQRTLKPFKKNRIPLARGSDSLWGFVFLPNLDPNSLFAARTLAQALSEHVLRPHLTVLLVSLQHTLRYFGSWDAMARVYHAQVQHLPESVRPRLLLSHHLFAGLHFAATHTHMNFVVADANNLVFRNHLSHLTWSQWREACLLFASLLQLSTSETKELVRGVSQFSQAALSMRFTSPHHFPPDLDSEEIVRRFGRWAVIFWEMWSHPEGSFGCVFKDLPHDLCAQDFLTTNTDCEEFSLEPCYPLATLQPMLESCFKRLLNKLSVHSSLEQCFGVRDFRITLEVENNLKIQHTCQLNEPISVFNKTTRLVLENAAAKLPHKGQEFQHPTEPSFYFKAFHIYRLTLEPLRIVPCSLDEGRELHTQRAPLPLEQVIQNLELKDAGAAFQLPLQAHFSPLSEPTKENTTLLESTEELNTLIDRRSVRGAPASLFRYAVQERPFHLLKETVEFSMGEFFSTAEPPLHQLEYLESIESEDFYALHTTFLPTLLLTCRSGTEPAEALFSLKGIFEPRGSPLQERLF